MGGMDNPLLRVQSVLPHNSYVYFLVKITKNSGVDDGVTFLVSFPLLKE